MSPVHRRGPVFLGSLLRDTEATQEQKANGGDARHRLAALLWEHLSAMDSPLWQGPVSSAGAALPIQVVRDPLGKPHLLVGERRGPAISFSEGGGAVWAALCGDESEIGIDVAEADEFQGDYPLHRVFHAQELHHALRLTGGEAATAAAMLWSAKEAIAKALGCGFHLVEPRDIHVHPSVEGDGGYVFPVSLSRKAAERLPLAAGRPLWVRSLPRGKGWLSVAFLDGPRRGGDAQRRHSSAPWKRNADS